MTDKMQTGLIRRGARYSIRRRIPLDLVQHYGGKAEVTRALGTADPREAKRLAALAWAELDREFEAARAKLREAEPSAPAVQPVGWWDTMSEDEFTYQVEMIAWDQQDQLEAEFDPLRSRIAEAVAADRRAREEEAREGLRLLAAEKKAKAKGAGPLLTALIGKWSAESKPTQKTIEKAELMVSEFYAVVGELGVDAITKKHVLAFKDRLLSPTAGVYGRGLSPGTINNKLNQLRTLTRYALANDLIQQDPVLGVRVDETKAPGEKVIQYGEAELAAVFSSPVYRQDARPVGGKGEAAYWLPLLALYTGARLNELGQLRPGDVVQEAYIGDDDAEHTAWVIRIVIDEADGLRLKNRKSQRRIPVHPELERLGFLQFVAAAKRGGQARIFPDLKPNKFGVVTAKWGDWYGTYLRKTCGVTDTRIVFHSFRHSFKHYARQSKLLPDVQNEITGHETGDVANNYGGLNYPLAPLVEGMNRYRVPRFTPPAPPPALRDLLADAA